MVSFWNLDQRPRLIISKLYIISQYLGVVNSSDVSDPSLTEVSVFHGSVDGFAMGRAVPPCASFNVPQKYSVLEGTFRRVTHPSAHRFLAKY